MEESTNGLHTTEILSDSHGRETIRAPERWARLTILVGPSEGSSVDLTDACVIGRGGGATLRLKDAGVSRRHLSISRLASGEYELRDEGSRNGTLVNGQPVTRHRLRSGDRIQVGATVLLLFSTYDTLEDSMLQAQTVATIGRLSAGINHDFNNLLCVILSNAAYLRELPQGMTLGHMNVRECLDDLHAAAKSGAELTAQLSAFAENAALTMEPVNLSELCRNALDIARATFPSSVEIHERIRPGLWVRGIPAHLRQLVMNPLLNARDAMPKGGRISAELSLELPADVSEAQPLSADAYVAIVVQDDGEGMDQVTLRRAFEPFFTTKDITLGSGLGLPMVRRVAKSHGGHVALDSSPGQGTTVRILLPLVPALSGGRGRPDADEAGPEAAPGTGPSLDGGIGGLPEPGAHQASPTVENMVWRDETEPPSQASRASGQFEAGRRVLLVEPDDAVARAALRALAMVDVHVLREADLTQALQAAAQEPSRPFIIVDGDAHEPRQLVEACREHGIRRIVVLTSSPAVWRRTMPHVLAKPLAVEDILPFLPPFRE